MLQDGGRTEVQMKKSMTKKLTYLVLALLMAIPLQMISCKKGDEPQKPGDTETGEDSRTETEVRTDEWGQDVVESNIPEDLNFGGEEKVNFLVIEDESFSREWTADQVTDSLSREIFNRNAAVEKQLGVSLRFHKMYPGSIPNEYDRITERILKAGNAGLGEFDVVSNSAAYATKPSLIPFYLNFNDPKLAYFNFEKPWWNEYYRAASETFGKMYFMVGDVNLSVFDRLIAVYFNHNLCRNYGIDPMEVYQMVFDREWTYDKLYELTNDIHEDLNNDGAKDYGDLYGLIGLRASEACDGFLYSFGLRLTETDEQGMHSVISDPGMLSKMDTAMSMVQKLFYETKGSLATVGTPDHVKIFAEKRAVFNIDVLYHYAAMNALMRSLDDIYGVLPVPKYDLEQKDYYSCVQDMHNVISLMNHSTINHAAVSAVLELLCEKSYENVRPYYYEKIVKLRYTNDAVSSRVFDLLLRSTRWDFGDVYTYAVGMPRNRIWRGTFWDRLSFKTNYNKWVESLDKKLVDFDMNVLSALQ